MSSSNGMIILVIEVAIVAFAWYRAKGKFLFYNDINSLDGGAATFNFWFFFLNFLVGTIAFESIFLAILAAVLWFIRLKIKKD